ncbi:MAG: hypothetical protein CVU96_02340 [Firmicutes bacterium HGW-Firmicutes-20]|jgi:hypothetical protein|nr:MAG: hypothetical protein CVU96_02340 [Firmicutes bacterium HGW-Firmicutes-20]PKM67769.1 MAG: hypothetical protein CVU94_06140 [Firmicutes bacterium HGW-Firmicutes-19]
MNKQEYLRLLKQQMSHLDQDTSLDIMSQVLKIFDQKSATGSSEREIVEQLGNPAKLISTYRPSVKEEFSDDIITENDGFVEKVDEIEPLADKSASEVAPLIEVLADTKPLSTDSTISHSPNSVIVRFLLGLLIGFPILLVLFSVVLVGITGAGFTFIQGLIMTFDLPYRIWQFPFTIREDFSLLVGIGLIMVGSGLLTLFISALNGVFFGFKHLIKGNFRSFQ